MRRQAACSCGQLAVETTGEPIRVSVCHCLACQRRTGSAFGVQARFDRSNVKIAGRSSRYTRTGDSGTRATFHFCPDCASIVHYEPEALPDVIAVPVGAFADPGFPPPRFSVDESRRHAWVQMPESVEHLD
ncbi:MAG: GFA family protein [Steroidobacteraceae bacterium]